MGLFDGLFGGDKPESAGGGSSLGSNVNGLFSDPIFMSGLQILSNGLTRRPISQARSPLEGVPAMLSHFGDKQQEKDALKSVLLQSGYSAEEAERMARNPAIAKLAIEQKNNAKADAALANAANGPSMFGGGMSAAPATPASPAAKVASGGEETEPSAPASFGGSQQAFIASLMPKAMEASKATGVDPRIIVAQAALESGWGKSAPGNNLFGIKSHGQAGGNTLATTEVVNGQPVRTTDSFRAYASPEDSVKGYADFINTNPRYGAMKSAQGLDEQIAALQKSGYATDPNYGAKIKQIAAGISLPGAPQQTAQSQPQGQGQGLSRLPDSQVVPPAPGVPVASRGPEGLAYAAPSTASDAVQRGPVPGDPQSYAQTAPSRPLPAGVDPASLAQPAVQQGRVQVASSDPNFVPGGAAPDDQALKPATIAEGKKAVAATPPPQPNPNAGASTQRAQAIQVFNHWSRVLPIAGRYGEKGKGLMEQAKQEMELAKEFLKPTDLEKQLDAMDRADPVKAAIIRNSISDNRPTNTREYDFYSKQETAAGRAPKSFEDWDIFRRRAQNQNETGTIPAGYKMTRGADGSVSMTPIPGSPAEQEANAAAKKAQLAERQTKTVADVVTQDIDRALDLTKSANIPVTGGVGNIASRIPGTAAHDVNKLLDGIKSNISFDRLQQMRAASPTGGALGSVSDSEGRLLQAAYGSLEQSQTQEQFTRNMTRLKRLYVEIVHGVDGADAPAAPANSGGKTSGGIQWKIN